MQCLAWYALFGLIDAHLCLYQVFYFSFFDRILNLLVALILEKFDLNLEFLKKKISFMMISLPIKELTMFFMPSKVDGCWQP